MGVVFDPALSRSVDLTTEDHFAGAGRRFTRIVLWSWGLHRLVDDACQVTGELIANAYPGGSYRLTLRLDPARGVVRILVRDRREGKPEERVAGADDESGRGLLIVGILADDWGYEHSATGNTVWAEFAVRGYAT
jgi:hypothetical protein